MDQATKQNFSLSEYDEMLSEFIGSGYQTVSFAEAAPDEQHLVLRHDVDFDLDAALTMAELEADRGISASYFILLRTEFYNIYTRHGTDVIRRLTALGHDVGLHFDPAFHQDEDTDLAAEAAKECDLLATVADQAVGVFSFHRPPQELLAESLEVPERINAYDARYFRDMGYCSDSRGAWLHGHPLDSDAFAKEEALQLLTHPIWWPERRENNSQRRLTDYLARRVETLDVELARNCQSYQSGETRLIKADD
ncbi:MAG TPA: hypothetical protein EYQ81_16090 [Sneathiellales bacterium]|nr:hypothetical protein [Sneathiellales bacterium]